MGKAKKILPRLVREGFWKKKAAGQGWEQPHSEGERQVPRPGGGSVPDEFERQKVGELTRGKGKCRR